MRFAKSVFAAAAMALACGVALAKDDDHKGFNDMDKNADGKLTRAEAKGKKDLLGKWKEADSNNDGVLSRAEYLKVMAKKDANTVKEKVTGDERKRDKVAKDDDRDHKGFNDLDKNNDGKLTRAEAAGKKDLLGKWKQADTNNDGVLTRGEYLTVMAKKDANTVKEKVKEEVNEAKRRTPDAASGSTAERKTK